MTRQLPPTASVATPQIDGKLHAPAAERNAEALCALLVPHAPETGQALEIASGTGQHIIRFAAAMPGVIWHPTDIEPARLISIDAHAAEAKLANLRPAQHLDATVTGWSAEHGAKDLIVVVNLLHLISEEEAHTLVSEAARALSPDGRLLIYGPFRRDGQLTSAGDAQFDAELRAADPQIGYKDDHLLRAWLENAGLADVSTHEMPANNLSFIARRD